MVTYHISTYRWNYIPKYCCNAREAFYSAHETMKINQHMSILVVQPSESGGYIEVPRFGF